LQFWPLNFHKLAILTPNFSPFAKGLSPTDFVQVSAYVASHSHIILACLTTWTMTHVPHQHGLPHILLWHVSHCPCGKTWWCDIWDITCHVCIDLVKGQNRKFVKVWGLKVLLWKLREKLACLWKFRCQKCNLAFYFYRTSYLKKFNIN
jgi:hypothetical protein